MRRSTAISQVVLLLAFYVVPLLAASPISLPACCRKDGAHHCTMQEHATDGETALRGSAQCPYRFPSIVLTCATNLFFNSTSATTHHPDSQPIVLSGDTNFAVAQPATALDNRGPPSLTL